MLLDSIQTYLQEHNREWAEHFKTMLPSLHTGVLSEQWKHFPLSSVLSSDVIPLFPEHIIHDEVSPISLEIPKRDDVHTIVFFNGVYMHHLSDEIEGVTVVDEPAFQRETYAHVGELISHATASAKLIHVDASFSSPKPIRIVRYLQAVGTELAIPSMATLAVETSTPVHVIEETIVEGTKKIVDIRAIEYRVYEGSSLHVTTVATGHDTYMAMTSVHTFLSRNAHATLLLVGTGGDAEHHDVRVELSEGASADLYAGFAPRKKQVRNMYTQFIHSSPHTTSTQIVRSVPFDFAKTTLDAMIYVAPDAQKVDASFYGKALMMSNDAKGFVRPKLEIYADDVKCAHGASVGYLIPEQMEYMRSRGLGEMQARSTLAFAFLQEVYGHIPYPWLREKVLQSLEEVFYLS